ncbi:MAG: hypothetical protein AB7K36_17095, partial [Chloroflexota bacterium]
MSVQHKEAQGAGRLDVRADGRPEAASAKARKAARKPKRGAIAQVVLFTSIWSTLVSLFGLLAVLPTLLGVLQQRG